MEERTAITFSNEDRAMNSAMRTGLLGSIVTALALGVAPALAQTEEQVTPVFGHAIPNLEGKSMVAVV